MYWIIFLTRNQLPDHVRSVFADQFLQTLDKVLHLSSQVDQGKVEIFFRILAINRRHDHASLPDFDRLLDQHDFPHRRLPQHSEGGLRAKLDQLPTSIVVIRF